MELNNLRYFVFKKNILIAGFVDLNLAIEWNCDCGWDAAEGNYILDRVTNERYGYSEQLAVMCGED